MKALKTLGTYDSNSQPKVVPNYCIEAVINQGADLPWGKNYEDYVNIVELLTDYRKDFKSYTMFM